MGKYACSVCGYNFDEAKGIPESGIVPGTSFEDLQDDWVCPFCGAAKDQFLKQGESIASAEKEPITVMETSPDMKDNKNKEVDKMTGSKTKDNLMEAFAGESQANRKYTAYAKKAEKEGKMNVAKLFRAAADAETLHALKEFEVAGKVGSTADNLKDAVAGETHEYQEMYPPFIKDAEAEGNKAAAMIFNFAMKAEEVHARLYQEALENLDQTEEVFYYLCPVCGNIEKFQPEKCSICSVPGEKFIKY